MGLQKAFLEAFGDPKRTLRILWMKFILLLRLLTPLPNYIAREKTTGIAQPAFYNSWSDIRG